MHFLYIKLYELFNNKAQPLLFEVILVFILCFYKPLGFKSDNKSHTCPLGWLYIGCLFWNILKKILENFHHTEMFTTTKEGYIAIQISSQTTKKKVSENPQLQTTISRKLLSCYETITFAPVQSQVLRNSRN